MGDKLLLNFGTISVLICKIFHMWNYKITNWQLLYISEPRWQQGFECWEQRCFRKPKHKKEHIKKDSVRYFVENCENYKFKTKFKLLTFQWMESSIDTIDVSKTND